MLVVLQKQLLNVLYGSVISLSAYPQCCFARVKDPSALQESNCMNCINFI